MGIMQQDKYKKHVREHEKTYLFKTRMDVGQIGKLLAKGSKRDTQEHNTPFNLFSSLHTLLYFLCPSSRRTSEQTQLRTVHSSVTFTSADLKPQNKPSYVLFILQFYFCKPQTKPIYVLFSLQVHFSSTDIIHPAQRQGRHLCSFCFSWTLWTLDQDCQI